MSKSRNEFVANLPEGCKHLNGNFYLVPFGMIRTPERNPRLNTEKGQADIIDKTLSMQLRESIRKNTLLNPLVCRWVNENGNMVPMIIGGDRRHRALSFLISKKEMVIDPRQPRMGEEKEKAKMVAADEAYEFVTCQIFMCADDLEALALSWAENKTRINLTDGHEIAELIQLRDSDATDTQIMEILQQDQKWLADTDRLIASLDSKSLADLLESRIDRNGAIELAAILDPVVREEVRIEAHRLAKETWDKKIARIMKKIQVAEEVEEQASGNVVFSDGDESRTQAQNDLNRARTNLQNLRRTAEELAETPTSSSDVRESARSVTGSTPQRPRRRGPQGGARKMRHSEIEKGLEIFQSIVRSNGEIEGESFTARIDAMKLIVQIFRENIIPNNADWIGTLRKFYS
jgi:predicted mannosyl-3-phosphoglycerate phosphatase (HAD superfamily)